MAHQCIKGKFGNCGPIKTGDDYCLFHKPNKNRDEAHEFYAELKKQATVGSCVVLCKGNFYEDDVHIFKDNINWGEYVFPTVETGFFVGSKFKGEAIFTDAVFEGEANFSGAEFEGHVSFMFVRFKGGILFNLGVCAGVANYRGSIFEGLSIFIDSKFEDRLIFSGCNFLQNVEIYPVECRLTQAVMEASRVQRISHEKAGEKEAAEAMFVREMRAKRSERKTQHKIVDGKTVCFKKKVWEKDRPLFKRFRWDNLFSHLSTNLEMVLIDWTSIYGTSWQRVIVAALLIIIVFAGCYYSAPLLTSNNPRIGGIYTAQPAPAEFLINFEYDPAVAFTSRSITPESSNESLVIHVAGDPTAIVEVKTQERLPVKNFVTLLYFSASTFSTTGYGDLYPIGLIKLFTILQSLLGVFFGALFVVVFARKWMR